MPRKLPPAGEQLAAEDVFRPWLLAATTALALARPLLPSEGGLTSGDSLVFVFLPLVLWAVWALRGAMRGGTLARLGAIDIAMLALVAWHGVSALVATRTGAPRLAINAAWQWVAAAGMFFLVRQLVQGARETRALAAVMIALAVALSTFGFHQFFVSIPRDQAHFAADPEAAMKEAGITAPPDSRQRVLFEKRVNSSEPMATFALANSLAGFLTPWLIVSLGICAVALVRRSADPRLWLPAALCASVILACLILTKSRSAVVGVGAGIGLLALWSLSAGAILSRRLIVAGVTIVAALAVIAAAVGALDRQVFTEAGKSLGYRLQYWRATGRMIVDSPWFGCGPGQFQNTYTHYKLPEASETVADPHNFLLEVWGTAGTPAAVALLLVLSIFAWRVLRFGELSACEPARDAAWHIIGGGAAGFLFALLLGPLATVPLGIVACAGGLLVWAIALGALSSWVRHGEMRAMVLAVATLALLVNLLAGGGINYAGVAWMLWLLIALALATLETPRTLSPARCGAMLIAALTLSACFYLTAYQPTMNCNLALDRADAVPEQAEQQLRAAAVADPLSAEPTRRLAALVWSQWQRYSSPAAFERFQSYIGEAQRLDPRSAPLAEQAGDVYLEVHRQTLEAEPLKSAVASYERAVTLYPTSILAHAKLALALAQVPDRAGAAAAATEALRLHELTPHADLKLDDSMVKRLRALAAEAN